MKFCVRGHLADVIDRAKFYLNRIRGFDSVGGQIFGFPIVSSAWRKASGRANWRHIVDTATLWKSTP